MSVLNTRNDYVMLSPLALQWCIDTMDNREYCDECVSFTSLGVDFNRHPHVKFYYVAEERLAVQVTSKIIYNEYIGRKFYSDTYKYTCKKLVAYVYHSMFTNLYYKHDVELSYSWTDQDDCYILGVYRYPRVVYDYEEVISEAEYLEYVQAIKNTVNDAVFDGFDTTVKGQLYKTRFKQNNTPTISNRVQQLYADAITRAQIGRKELSSDRTMGYIIKKHLPDIVYCFIEDRETFTVEMQYRISVTLPLDIKIMINKKYPGTFKPREVSDYPEDRRFRPFSDTPNRKRDDVPQCHILKTGDITIDKRLSVCISTSDVLRINKPFNDEFTEQETRETWSMRPNKFRKKLHIIWY